MLCIEIKRKEYNNSVRLNLNDHLREFTFAILNPEDYQPSGTIPMSRIDNYNVLRIMSGFAGLAYSN